MMSSSTHTSTCRRDIYLLRHASAFYATAFIYAAMHWRPAIFKLRFIIATHTIAADSDISRDLK